MRARIIFFILFKILLQIVICSVKSNYRNEQQWLLNTGLICSKYRRVRGSWANFCERKPKLFKAIVSGVTLATRECQHQLKYRQWNCNALPKILAKIMFNDTPEAGFVDAITAAAVTYAVAEACTEGRMAACLRNSRSVIVTNRTTNSKAWPFDHYRNNSVKSSGKRLRLNNGCVDSIKYGYQVSKLFVNTLQRSEKAGLDIKSLIKLHNTRVGRLTVLKSAKIVCKCHGITGSCLLKTCHKKLPPFREIGRRLKKKLDLHAIKVSYADNERSVRKGYDNHFLIENVVSLQGSSLSSHKVDNVELKSSLIYIDESYDYCNADNVPYGSISGRSCLVNTSSETETCRRVCCDKNFKREIRLRKTLCRCKFVWCCKIICDFCLKTVDDYTCL